MSNHGLTADNMMQQFPIALQKDPKTVALGQAIAKVMESRQDEIDSLRIYTRIDELPEWLLDILARDFAVDWYDRSYTLEEKRKTIKDSFYVHRHRGTKAAVERAISAIYPNPKVLEWFEYGGDPSNSVSRLISLQSMRPNISRFCKKSSATKIFGRIWTASFTTRKRSRKRAMLQRFPAPQRCPTRFLCRVLSSRGQSAHTPAPLVRSAQLG